MLRQRNRWAHTAVSVYACVCFHTSCLLEHYLFIYLLALEVNVENRLFDLISYHKKCSLHMKFSGRKQMSIHTPTHLPIHTSIPQHLLIHTHAFTHPRTCTPIHPHGSNCMLVSLPGVAAACSELCYMAYGIGMAHATKNIQTKKAVLYHCGHA